MKKVNKIDLLILDIDGVLTDGRKWYDKNGKAKLKVFCDKDWTTIKRFKAINVKVIFLTGDSFNEQIALNRKIDVYVNRKNNKHVDKKEYLDEICKKYNTTTEKIAYFGDDLFDIGIMRKIKYPFCLKDSPKIVKKYSTTIDCIAGENAVLCLYEHMENEKIIYEADYNDLMKKIYELDIKESF